MADQNLWRKNVPEDFQGKMADEWDGEIPLKPIFWSTFAIALSVFIAFVLNIWIMNAWDGWAASKVRVSPLLEAQERFEHVNPKLQASPEAELLVMKEEDEEHLGSYGWVDTIERRVHIPVERAMEIVLDEKGTPAATGESIEPPQDEPLNVDAGSDSQTDSQTEESQAEPQAEPQGEDTGGDDAAAAADHGNAEDH